MPDDEQPKVPGRPRRHASDGARGAAYQRRAAGVGLVRVSVMVPASRRPDIIAIAAAMRTLRRAPAERISDAGPYPMAGKPWRLADDTLLRLVWRDGGTVAELASLQRPLDQVLARIVALEEAGSVAEVRAEFLARSRAEAIAEIGTRRS